MSQIRDLNKTECYILAYYFYKISHLLKETSISDIADLFEELRKRLDKKAQAEHTLELHLKKLVALKQLHKAKKDSYLNHFGTKEKMKYHFEEDAYVSRHCGFNSSITEIPINIARCISYGDEKILSQIILQTFFSRGIIECADDDVRVPASVIKNAFDTSKINFLSDAIDLTDDEKKLLITLYHISNSREFFDVLSNLSVDEEFEAYSCITKIPVEKIKDILDEKNTLKDFSLVHSHYKTIIANQIKSCIDKKSLSPMFEGYLKETVLKNCFAYDSFAVSKGDSTIAKNMILSDKPVSLLLYGAAGSGKTEFAKSLVNECGLNAFIFKNSSELSEQNAAINHLHFLLSIKKDDSVIIIDEAESILETATYFYESQKETQRKKGAVNKMFERNRNKVIWIVNYTDMMDESTLRRFTYSIQFNEMPERTLRSIAQTKLQPLNLSHDAQTQVVNLCSKYHVTGASVDNVVTALSCINCKDENELLSNARNVLEANSTLLFGKAKMRETVNSSYDLNVLNTSVSAEEIVSMVENALSYAEKNSGAPMGIRMLFYGVSGTGKTELARYISERLGKRILLKRASDILGKYVGENEQNIRKAFAEAEATDKILLFDEADSFFADRNSAQRSWERTMVNEFLTQMEEFSGILICTTNLRNIMDSAMQRRFHILAEFKPLTESGIKALLEKYFPFCEFDSEQTTRLACYDSVTPGDFSALAGKARFLPSEKITSNYIVDELVQMQEEKNSGNSRRIGFVA